MVLKPHISPPAEKQNSHPLPIRPVKHISLSLFSLYLFRSALWRRRRTHKARSHLFLVDRHEPGSIGQEARTDGGSEKTQWLLLSAEDSWTQRWWGETNPALNSSWSHVGLWHPPAKDPRQSPFEAGVCECTDTNPHTQARAFYSIVPDASIS